MFANLNYDQYVAIRNQRPPIWINDGRGIAVEPLHRGFVFTDAIDLFLVEDGVVQRIGYDPAQFDYGRLSLPQNLGDVGYSGFRLVANSGDGKPFDFAIIQGATFFRAIARGQNFGAIARALTLKPADPKGEEFPVFRAFWLERPAVGSNSITVHGLLDSESTSGAIRMTFRPGDMTIVDVETTLFPRVNLDHVGLGGIASTYFYGPNDRPSSDDIRPAVYESSGLQMLNGKGEWLWRPLQNPNTLQISAFVDQAPKGFGLLQRDRSFETFQDDDQRFDRRPSLWIEPLGRMGPGKRSASRNPHGRRDQRQHSRLLASQSPYGGWFRGPVRLSPVLVLGSARAAAFGNRARNPRGTRLGRPPPAIRRGIHHRGVG